MSSLFQILSLFFLVIILFSLFRALLFMLSGKSASGATVKALSWRVAISLVLFLMLSLLHFYSQ